MKTKSYYLLLELDPNSDYNVGKEDNLHSICYLKLKVVVYMNCSGTSQLSSVLYDAEKM